MDGHSGRSNNPIDSHNIDMLNKFIHPTQLGISVGLVHEFTSEKKLRVLY